MIIVEPLIAIFKCEKCNWVLSSPRKIFSWRRNRQAIKNVRDKIKWFIHWNAILKSMILRETLRLLPEEVQKNYRNTFLFFLFFSVHRSMLCLFGLRYNYECEHFLDIW
jgi:hypothetical protein